MGYKTKEFFTNEGWIDRQINEWLEKNENIKIIDIRYSLSVTDESVGSGCLILYDDCLS